MTLGGTRFLLSPHCLGFVPLPPSEGIVTFDTPWRPVFQTLVVSSPILSFSVLEPVLRLTISFALFFWYPVMFLGKP